jgi:radical SAM superfamily enzyme YgiQ (UPF0313 family)
MTDIVFAAVPHTNTNEPTMAPALLKSIAVKHGYSSIALDLNIEIINILKHHKKESELVDFFIFAKENPELADDVAELIDYSAKRILSYQPKIIGLSLLTYRSQIFTLWLSIKLKMLAPETPIIIGGPGIKNFLISTDNNFCEYAKSLGLIDHYITGDGELSLVEFLNGNLDYPGINSENWIQPTELDQFPYPDYTDYNFDQYTQKVVPVTDSRGCVRACEFCDVIEHWKKYVYRSAESVFDEMLYQIARHGMLDFTMRNSLTNGNMKEFKKFLDLVGAYNQARPSNQQIYWQGYFIIREKNQHPEEFFQKIKASNGSLWLGVESVIEHVRRGMGKNFSNESIDYHLEMTQKYQIPVTLLVMTGNPTETLDDYEFTKQWFRDRYRYAGNSVEDVNLSLASILPGTEWDRKQQEMNIEMGKFPVLWINQETKITAAQRTKHWEELIELCVPYQGGDRLKRVDDVDNKLRQGATLNLMKMFSEGDQ